VNPRVAYHCLTATCATALLRCYKVHVHYATSITTTATSSTATAAATAFATTVATAIATTATRYFFSMLTTIVILFTTLR
jgi:hypothetical protein